VGTVACWRIRFQLIVWGRCRTPRRRLPRLGKGGGALTHHGDAAGYRFGHSRIGGHGGHLILPEIEIAARQRLQIRRRI
jgi:hypothetical protein